MGFFKSSSRLMQQANEIGKDWNPAQQVTDATAQMRAANESLAQQTAAIQVATTGVDATAMIVAVRQARQMINYQPTVELDLLVQREGQLPYPVTVMQVLPQIHLAKAQPRNRVSVKVDPDNPATLWVDWDRSAM